MAIKLREALRNLLVDWQSDLPVEWREVLEGVEPDFAGVNATLLETQPIYPGRKNSPIAGAPAGADVFRGFTRIKPAKVRTLLIGQDPYPKLSQATGLAFEQGGLAAWPAPAAEVAASFRRLLQVTAFHRKPDPAFLVEAKGWLKVDAALQTGSLAIEPPRELFRHWEDEGVMFLNIGLTYTGKGPQQKDGHFVLWRPILHRIIQHLVTRKKGALAILTFGAPATATLLSSGVTQLPQWGQRADTAKYGHPATAAFLKQPDPFTAANDILARFGGEPIVW